MVQKIAVGCVASSWGEPVRFLCLLSLRLLSLSLFLSSFFSPSLPLSLFLSYIYLPPPSGLASFSTHDSSKCPESDRQHHRGLREEVEQVEDRAWGHSGPEDFHIDPLMVLDAGELDGHVSLSCAVVFARTLTQDFGIM